MKSAAEVIADPAGSQGVEGVKHALLRGPHDDRKAEITVAEGKVDARVNVGEYVVEWTRA